MADRLIGRQIDTNGDGTYDAAARYVNDWSAAPQTNGAPNGLGIGTGLDATLFAFDGSGSLTNRYLSGPAVDQVFADERASGALYWSLADNLGTVRDVAQYNSGTNTTTVVNHVKYDSFGNITAQSDSTKQPLFAYTGRQWDSDAGLQYTRARWYDPRIGRFISEDPSGFDGGDLNLSRYVKNQPAQRTDPSGLIGSSESDQTSPSNTGLWNGGTQYYPTPLGATSFARPDNFVNPTIPGGLLGGTTPIAKDPILNPPPLIGVPDPIGDPAGYKKAIAEYMQYMRELLKKVRFEHLTPPFQHDPGEDYPIRLKPIKPPRLIVPSSWPYDPLSPLTPADPSKIPPGLIKTLPPPPKSGFDIWPGEGDGIKGTGVPGVDWDPDVFGGIKVVF